MKNNSNEVKILKMVRIILFFREDENNEIESISILETTNYL